MRTKSTTDPPASPPRPPPDPKREKNANDQGGRKRVSQACDTCRSKKLKCDSLRPRCSSCVAQERGCVYGTVTKKRGLPEGYVRGLERLLALCISEDGGGSVNSKFQQALVNETTRADLVRQWNAEMDDGETLAEAWRNSQLCIAFETLLPELDASDGRGRCSKKIRLGPHAVGMEPGTTSVRSFKPGLQNPETIPESGQNVGQVGDESPWNKDTGISDPSNFGPTGETPHVPSINLKETVLPNVSPYSRFDARQGSQPNLPIACPNANTQNLDSSQSTFSVPDNISGVVDEFALDLNFHSEMGTDELFYEMSNLDYL